jgi:NAD(P)-dependent dehydrogenase (short-subunit alcohol dehydrogenase family)
VSASGRTYVVTGSASGIGAATRAQLEAAGGHVVGVDVRDAEVVADLRLPADRASLRDAVARRAPSGIDGIVACAGVRGSEGGADPDTIIRVNYFGAVATFDGLRPLLAESAAPRAVVVSSITAVRKGKWQEEVVEACLAGDEERAIELCESSVTAYSSSKRAIARYLRRAATSPEWGGAGIVVNSVGPGLIETPMTIGRLSTPEQRAGVLEENPQVLGIGKPEQVAALLVWLASPENSFVTGQLIFVDGGQDAATRGNDIP